MPTYARLPVHFSHGDGAWLFDDGGERYLDALSGIAVCGLGHAHPAVTKAIAEQAGRLVHTSNLYGVANQERLAEMLVELTGMDSVFFGNSGAEANEAAIKLARAWGANGPGAPRYELITFSDAFHGRTLATITATGQAKYQKGFEPLVEGFVTNVPFNDFVAVEKARTEKTVAVMMELVQGEGGVQVATPDFVRKVREFCTENKLLLIVDEVQTGMGRTGRMFGYQHYGITPDVMTLAKSLGGGLPIGVAVAHKDVADTLRPGMHASTFGGGAVVCRAALGVFKAIQKDKMLANVGRMAPYLFERLEALKKKHAVIKEVRGLGFMIGIELNGPGAPVFEKCLEKGLLINCTHETVLRLMPALGVTKKQADFALGVLDEVLGVLSRLA